MSKNRKVDFSDGKILSNILQSAFPMLIAQLISLLYNVVDRIYIGRIPEVGTAALAAVGLCFPITIMVIAFTNMFGMGGSPLFSMELGRGNRIKAAAIQNTAFRMLIFSAIVLTFIGEATAEPLLVLFGADKDSLIYALPYIRIYLWGNVFSMISTGMNPYINAQGYPTIGMTTVLIGAGANLILDPIFIFLFGMGVSGAAVATVISQLLSAIFVLRFFLGPKNELRLSARPRIAAGEGEKKAVIPWVGNIMALGMTPFIMQFTNALVSVVCNSVLMKTGGEIYVSVMTIISSVRQVLDTPVMAATNGSSPVISFNYGAGKMKEVRKAIWVMTFLSTAYTLCVWLLIEQFPMAFISIFTPDPVLRETALRPVHLYFFTFVFQSLQYSGQTVYRSLNKKNKAIFFSLFRKVVLVIPLVYLLPHVLNPATEGVFIAEPVSNLIGGLACFITMLVTVFPELRRIENAQKAKSANRC